MMRVTVTVAWAPLLAGRGGRGGRRGRCELLSSTKAAAAGPGPGREARGVRRQVPGGAVYAGEGAGTGRCGREGAGDGQVWAGGCVLLGLVSSWSFPLRGPNRKWGTPSAGHEPGPGADRTGVTGLCA